MAGLTPMMAQYMKVKEEYQDCILMFRLGDFYEMFLGDAEEASRILGITLTARNKKGENKIPMCGVPFHALDQYLWKLTKFGKKVAICDQVSPPGNGIVEREVTRVVTPGTTFDEKVIDNKSNNYLTAVVKIKNSWGFAIADLTTGEFLVSEFNNEEELFDEIKKFRPKEILVTRGIGITEKMRGNVDQFGGFVFEIDDPVNPLLLLTSHFGVKNIDVFGLNSHDAGICAAGGLISYLLDTQKNELPHIQKISFYRPGDFMLMDDSLIRNLELFMTNRDGRVDGSLISVLDNTETSMGGRLLRKLLVTPLVDRVKIEKRLSVVESFKGDSTFLRETRELLSKIYDIERLLSRLSMGNGNARDLVALKQSLQVLPDLRNILGSRSELKELCNKLYDVGELTNLIEEAINDEAPISVRDGGMIKSGYNQELDELRLISKEGKGFIAELQKREVEKTGINTLKIKYNKIFGYHIEVSKANSALVPDYYIRKQTLVNAERYFIQELKEYEDKILNAEDRIKDLEYELFYDVRMAVLENLKKIQEIAQSVSFIDVFSTFAFNAEKYNYSKPIFSDGVELEIVDGRHPVIEQLKHVKDFVANDTLLSEERSFMLITGPNMGGKSTYLRQVALAVLMSQIGSFVPAKSMKSGVVDKIFTRVGASDNLVTGDSTFMVEMQETAYILNHATRKSLIILDEIGRGTSTYDGMSIAWSLMEHIHNNIGAKTLFATHYHELVDLVDDLPRAVNYSVMVKEKEGDLKFMYKVIAGAVSKSYGIEVAKLAGLPSSMIDRAREVLRLLEDDKLVGSGGSSEKISTPQLIFSDFEGNRNHQKIVDDLKNIDLNQLTPLEALNKLSELKENIEL